MLILLAVAFGLGVFYTGSRLFFHFENWSAGADWYDRGSSPSQRIAHWAPLFFLCIFGLYMCFMLS